MGYGMSPHRPHPIRATWPYVPGVWPGVGNAHYFGDGILPSIRISAAQEGGRYTEISLDVPQ